MICPYICNIRQRTKFRFVYDEEAIENKIVEEIVDLQELKEPMLCVEHNCAAWDKHKQRCIYGRVEANE
jgi:hypothetical protein